MAAQDNLKLYVRGFFGSKMMSNETYHPVRSQPILSVFDLNPEALKHVVCNESVVSIYTQMVMRQVIHTDFDFRERAIKVALSAFGVDNFHLWVKLNAASPMFTQTHADFITDTVRFIMTGKRNLPVGTWEQVISPGSNDPNDEIEFDPQLMSCLPTGYSTLRRQPTQANLHNIIALWLSRDGGFTDMVVTLYTLFGEHNTR